MCHPRSLRTARLRRKKVGTSTSDRGYVGLLIQRLRERTGRPVEVVNLSRSGAHILDVLDMQLPALAARARTPDLLTVAIGGNDMGSYDRQVFAASVERRSAALPAGAHLTDVPYLTHDRSERDAQEAADLLSSSVSQHGLRPMPRQATFRVQGWRGMSAQFAADWVHPNGRGHRIGADALWWEITRNPGVAAPQ